jgi:hypothetical protein
VAEQVFLRDAAQQHDRLGDHQLGHAAGIGIGRVEHRDAERARGIEIDLVGADAEATRRDQPARMLQHLGGELGARADAEDVRLGDARLEFLLRQRARVTLDLAVAGALEDFHRARAHAFQQQHADVLARKRGLHR